MLRLRPISSQFERSLLEVHGRTAASSTSIHRHANSELTPEIRIGYVTWDPPKDKTRSPYRRPMLTSVALSLLVKYGKSVASQAAEGRGRLPASSSAEGAGTGTQVRTKVRG